MSPYNAPLRYQRGGGDGRTLVDEREGASPEGDPGGGQGRSSHDPGGVGEAFDLLPAGEEDLYALPAGRRRGADASRPGPSFQPGQARCGAGEGDRPLPGAVPGLWSHFGVREACGGGCCPPSRDLAAMADPGAALGRFLAQGQAPVVPGTEGPLRGAGPSRRGAPALVRDGPPGGRPWREKNPLRSSGWLVTSWGSGSSRPTRPRPRAGWSASMASSRTGSKRSSPFRKTKRSRRPTRSSKKVPWNNSNGSFPSPPPAPPPR